MRWFRHGERLGTPQQEIRRLGGFFVLIHEGAEIPRGYGIVWRDMMSVRAWCCPMPFHLIIGSARDVWMWFRFGRGRRRLLLVEQFAVEKQLHQASSERVRKLQYQVDALRRELVMERESSVVFLLQGAGMNGVGARNGAQDTAHPQEEEGGS